MAKSTTILGDLHLSKSPKHQSGVNQQLIIEGKQEGAIEYIPNADGGVDLMLTNTKGKTITNL